MTLTAHDADRLLERLILDEVARQDPPATFRQLHAGGSHWDSELGITVVAGYSEGLEVLRGPKWGRSEPDMAMPKTFVRSDRERSPAGLSMLMMNPPDHTRIRSLVARSFTPRMVERLRPQITEALEPLIDELAERGEADVMTTLAVPFPVAVISAMLGVPKEKGSDPEFVQQIRDLTSFIDSGASDVDIEGAELAAISIAMYFAELVEAKRSDPDDAMLSELIVVEEAGDRLSQEELVVNAILMYAAGFETTSNLIGNGLLALLRNPDQLQRLRDDPTLVGSAVMEILRYDSPVQINSRFALVETDLFGTTVPRGHNVMVLQGAGNHDPSVYSDPDRFDVGRFAGGSTAQPLSFGWGAHHCLGAHLARAEGEIVLAKLLKRFTSIGLVGPEPWYRPHATLRGLESLHVRVS